MLYRDFDMGELVITPEDSTTCLDKAKALIDPEVNLQYRRKIKLRLEEMRPANKAMWDKVVEVLNREVPR